MKPLVGAALGVLLLATAIPTALGVPTGRAGSVHLSHRDRLYDVTSVGDALYVVGHPGRFLRSKDGGKTFEDVAAGQKDEALFSLAFNAKGQGTVVGRSGFTLFSEDKGKSWQKSVMKLDDEQPSLFAVDVLPSGAVVAVGEFGLIVRSTDRGKTWQRSSFSIDVPPLSAEQAGKCALAGASENDNSDVVQESRLTDVHFVDEQNGYAVGEFGLILRSEDGGLTFKRQSSCTDAILYGLSVISAQRAIAVGADGSVVETRDAGKSWLPRPTNTQEHLFGVFATEQRAVVVGAAGTVLERTGDAPFSAAKTGVHTWLTSAWMDANGHGLIVGGRANLLQTQDGGRTQTRIFGE